MKNENLEFKQKSIFKRFINFIKNIFNKKSCQKQIAEPVEKIENDTVEMFVDNQDDEKGDFFNLYNSVKNKETDLSSISSKELFKFNSIIKEEINLKKQKIVEQEKLIDKLNESIESLKIEKEKLENKILTL